MTYHSGITGPVTEAIVVPYLLPEIAKNMSRIPESTAFRWQRWSPEQVTNAACFAAFTMIAAVMIVIRSWTAPDLVADSGIQVLLLAGSWLVASMIVREFCHTLPVPRWIPFCSMLLATIALIVWSASPPLAIAMAMPVCLATVVGLAFQLFGWRLVAAAPPALRENSREGSREAEAIPEQTGEDATLGNRGPPIVPDAANLSFDQAFMVPPADRKLPSLEEDEETEEPESDLWQAVQREFARDSNLTLSVARWSGADGTHTVVANIRCPIPAGARSSTVQLPVWPFLPDAPEVFCRVVDGDAAVHTLQARPNGVVAEVTLSHAVPANKSLAVVVEVVAMSCAAGAKAHAAA